MGQRLVIVLLLAALGAAAEPVVRSCAFEAHATMDGLEEGPEIEFELVWDEARLEAHMRSGGEVTPVTALRGDEGETTFFAVSGTGGLTITTVMPGGEAVHSQHAARGAALSASQHYGACR